MEVQREESKYKSPPDGPSFHCPSCHSIHIYKDGFRSTAKGKVQRHLCRDCGLRFSNPVSQLQVEVNVHSEVLEVPVPGGDLPEEKIFAVNLSPEKVSKGLTLPLSEDVASHSGEIEGQQLNTFCDYGRNRRVCADEAKNLVTVRETQTVDDISKLDKTIADSRVTEFMLYLRKTKKPATIESQVKIIKQLIKKGADLDKPQSVEDLIASQKCSEGRMRNQANAYANYLAMRGIDWDVTRYGRTPKIPWVPLEKDIDQLIAGCSVKIATYLQMLKETGARRKEAYELAWTDIELETKYVRITPAKGSNPRRLRISDKLIAMLSKLPHKNAYVFGGGHVEDFSTRFRKQRKRVAAKLGNDNINRINFKSLRHYKGTSEYLKTGDIYHVKKILGHKMIKNTEIYIQTAGEPNNDDWVSGVATTAQEAAKLVDLGYDFVLTTPDGVMIFRKRK